jgi:hypothetical protein
MTRGSRPDASGARGPRIAEVLRADIGRLQRSFGRPGGRASAAYRILSWLLNEKRGHHRYRMKILYAPPPGLLWSFRPGDGSPATFLHRFYARELWRERGAWQRLCLLAALPLWPLASAGTLAWFTWLNGAAVARRTGKSRLRQAAEQLRLAAAYDVLPPWYYIFELYDDAARRRAGEYLHRFETKGGLFRWVKRNRGGQHTPLADKLAFAAWCRDRGIPTAPVLLVADRGGFPPEVQPKDAGEPRLPEADVFVKPMSGRGGSGAQRFSFDPDGRYRDGRGAVLGHAELLAHIRRLSLTRPCLVQPRLVNHPELADLANGALSTVRVLTIENERGEFEATHAVLRMALGSDAIVDNFHAGGIAAPIDLRTGVLGRATDIGLRPDVGWCETHPDTHAKIFGRRLPYWPEALELARRAHAAFADRIVIGWDIALLPEGPVVIEGNGGPDVDIVERCYHEPLGNSRFGELLAFHLRRAAERSAGSPAESPRDRDLEEGAGR